MEFNKKRARLEILNFIVPKCSNTFMSDTEVTLNNLKEENGFILPKNEERNGIPIDTLVRLTFVRNTSEYYLGWLREVTGDGSFFN